LETKEDHVIDVLELISLFSEKFQFIIPSDFLDKKLESLFSLNIQCFSTLIMIFQKIALLLSEEQVQIAIQLFSKSSIINQDLINFFWTISDKIHDELTLCPVWKMLSFTDSVLLSEFLC
jgi:hypothetical protein